MTTSQPSNTSSSAVTVPSIWLDTNVMVEIFSQADLYAAGGDAAQLEQRRRLARGSLWLAIALDVEAAVTAYLKHETWDVLGALAPAGSPAYRWTARAFVFGASLFPRWIAMGCDADAHLPKGKAGNNLRDQLIVDLAKHHGMTLVSRDRNSKRGQPGVHKLATAAGVRVLDPEAYATTVLPLPAAEALFHERFGRAALALVDEPPGPPGAAGEWIDRVMAVLETADRANDIWNADGVPMRTLPE